MQFFQLMLETITGFNYMMCHFVKRFLIKPTFHLCAPVIKGSGAPDSAGGVSPDTQVRYVDTQTPEATTPEMLILQNGGIYHHGGLN